MKHPGSYWLKRVYFTSSNFLALYCSAPFRKFSNIMSHSTVPYIMTITKKYFWLLLSSLRKKNRSNAREKDCVLPFTLMPCIPVKLTTPTEVKAATMLMSVGIMLNFPAYKSEQQVQFLGRLPLQKCTCGLWMK